MVEYENECVGCSSIFHSCLGSMCPNRNVARFYCDECGEEKELYEFEEEELCIDCIKGRLKKIRFSSDVA